MANNPITPTQAAARVIAPSIARTQREQELDKLAQQIPSELLHHIGRRALRRQVVGKEQPYYSTVRFQFDPRPIAGGIEYVLSPRTLSAFAYGVNDNATTAGFGAGYQMTHAETNLIANDTSGKSVLITGIALKISEDSDAWLTKLVWTNCYLETTLDGSNRYQLIGRPGTVPASTGLYGTGQSRVLAPPLGASVADVGCFTNGLPHQNNYWTLKEPIRWNPASRIDSRFQLKFYVVREIRHRALERTATTTAAEFKPPTQLGEIGTYVDVTVHLRTHEISPRSKQA